MSTEAAAKPAAGGPSVMLVAFLSALLSGLVAYIVATEFVPKAQETSFVVVDSRRLLSASLAQVTAARLSEEDAAAAAMKFSDDLHQATQRLVDAGYVVLNGTAVLGISSQLDATQMIADDLGLQLD